MSFIKIDAEKCMGCAYCFIVCPVASFKVEGSSQFLQECIKCGRCVVSCPVSAITLLDD